METKNIEVEVVPKDSLEPEIRQRFEDLKKMVTILLPISIMAGNALREIRDKEYWKADGFDKFKDFLKHNWSKTPAYANQLIASAEVYNTLPEDKRQFVQSHNAFRQLGAIPAEFRGEVLEQATDGGKKPATAQNIKKASPKLPSRPKSATQPPKRPSGSGPKRPGPKIPPVTDKLGTEVPSESLELWNRRMTADEIVMYGNSMMQKLKKVQESQDLLFIEVDMQDAMSCLQKCLQELERAKPYALCPQCNGKTPKKECQCKGRGFVSQFYWNTFVPEELRNMRTAK
jgi:hypothetical protein